MKKCLLLLCCGFGFGTTRAQAPAAYSRILTIEAGATGVGIGAITYSGAQDNGAYKDDASGPAYNPSLLFRTVRISPKGWGFGLRAEVAIWQHNQSRQFYENFSPPTYPPRKENITVYYGSPAICLAPEFSKRVLRGRNELAVAAYFGLVCSPHRGSEGEPVARNGTYDPIYFPTSLGMQIGGELQYRHWLTPKWALSATAGFQRSFVRFLDYTSFNGYNLNNLPLTVGTSWRL